MESWTTGVANALKATHTRSMPLSRVRAHLLREGHKEAQNEGWFLTRLKDAAPSFRVIHDRVGPWTGCRCGRGGPQGRELPPEDPWVLWLEAEPVDGAVGMEGLAAAKLRECLQTWGRDLDEASPSAVARWIRASLETRGAQLHAR